MTKKEPRLRKQMEYGREIQESGSVQKTPTYPMSPGGMVIRYKNINPLWMNLQMENATKSPLMSALLKIARDVRIEAYQWVTSYATRNGDDEGYLLFKQDWSIVRLVISLQARLMVEQVLWDLGGRYRELVTGFRPLK